MVRKENLAVFGSSNISETRESTPTKIGVHAFDINLYLHDFFEPILFDCIFWSPWTISPSSERENWQLALSLKPEISEIFSFSNWAKFPFWTWTVVHGDQKYNQPKEFMEVEVDVKCIQTNFGEHVFPVCEIWTVFCFATFTFCNKICNKNN